MTDDTTPRAPVSEAASSEETEPNGKAVTSHFFNISLRGLLAIALVFTLCGLVIKLHTDKLVDAFVIIVSGAMSFYFGQGGKK